MTRPSRIERACLVASATLALALAAGCAEWPSGGYVAAPPQPTRSSFSGPGPAGASRVGTVSHREDGTTPTFRWPRYSAVSNPPSSTEVSEALALSTFGGSYGRPPSAGPEPETRVALPNTRTPHSRPSIPGAPVPALTRVADGATPIAEASATLPDVSRVGAPPVASRVGTAVSRGESYEQLLGVPIQPEGDAAGDPGLSVSRVSFAVEGADFDPDVSRDGREVAFASTQHRQTADIYVKRVGSRVVTQLTNDPAQDLMPKFSPDGGRIAFASNRNGNWDIFVMPSDGGRAVQVTDSTAHELHPSWSPDGTRLVFCRLGDVSGHWEMWVADAANAGLTQFVGYGMFPEWCPTAGTGDGGADRILFQRSRQRGDRSFAVWTIDFLGGDVRNATEVASSTTGACINPAWSPDGRWIVYATVPRAGAWSQGPSTRPPAAELWMADLNGASRVKLTAGGALALMPAWGSDGRIFFVSDRSGADNIWSLDAQGAVALASAMIARPGETTDVANVPEGEPDPGRE